jgi:hypothetical protein
MTPYPESEYPSILRGKDKRTSQRLLAAAPELLAACKAALDYFNTTQHGNCWRDAGGEEPDLLLAAILKAEGHDQ